MKKGTFTVEWTMSRDGRSITTASNEARTPDEIKVLIANALINSIDKKIHVILDVE